MKSQEFFATSKVFPQDRITDHRIKKSFHNIERIMEGKLDKIIEKLQKSSHTPDV